MEKEQLLSIVRGVQQGNEEAATALYNACYQELYYYIFKTVNEESLVEDLLQETFMEIFQTIGNLQAPEAYVNWSRQIAYHKCTAYFKKRHELLADEDEDGHSIFDNIEEDRAEFIPDEALDKEDFKQTIHGIINDLPEEQRSAILLRYFEEVSVKEIAEIQGVSEGTVKSRLNYGRKAIKDGVESYEKKTGVKLHCVGIVPLLLWLFRATKASAAVSASVAGSAAAATVAASTSAAAGASTAAATSTATAAATAAKTAGFLAGKKLVAGIVAAALVAGGATTGIILSNKEPEEPDKSVSQVKKSMNWVGYYQEFEISIPMRFSMDISQMNDKKISGHLEVSRLYEPLHDTAFTGVGTETEDGKILYQVTFDTPAVLGTIPTFEYSEMPLEYDKETETFRFTNHYYAQMQRVSLKTPKPFLENTSWTGTGEDDTYIGFTNENHQFEAHIRYMTETQVKGHLAVSYKGETYHTSDFTGRGAKMDGKYRFEVLLDTPRTVSIIGLTDTVDTFWLTYNPEKETLSIDTGYYDVSMTPAK